MLPFARRRASAPHPPPPPKHCSRTQFTVCNQTDLKQGRFRVASASPVRFNAIVHLEIHRQSQCIHSTSPPAPLRRVPAVWVEPPADGRSVRRPYPRLPSKFPTSRPFLPPAESAPTAAVRPPTPC